MKSRTHIAFAFLISLLTFSFLSSFEISLEKRILSSAIIIIASLLPDLDHPGSRLGRKVKPFSFLFKLFVGHRSVLHSIFIPLILFFLLLSYDLIIALSLLVGYFSHLVLDSFNYSGIMWFYPLKFRIKGFVKSGGVFDMLIFSAFILLIFYISFKHFF